MSLTAAVGPLANFVEAARRRPARPYRSLAPLRFADSELLAARDAEVERLVRFMTMFRGVLLYGQSGVGKSSVVNAGLLPRMAAEGYWPHRLRVQPWPHSELTLEPIVCADEGDNRVLPHAFDATTAPGERVVIAGQEFATRVEQAAAHGALLLVFDQFEELVTLTPQTTAGREASNQILRPLLDLLRSETIRAKLLFVFREDYLANLRPLLEAEPRLGEQAVRLTSPPQSCAATIVRAPFDRFPGEYPHELSGELARDIARQLDDRSDREELSLSELQIVASRLWDASDPEVLLAKRGVDGLLEDHFDEALREFPPAEQEAAIALLVQLITASGTRNVVGRGDLIDRAGAEHPHLAPELLSRTIERLDSESAFIRRERRHDVDLYELTSEFLIPRIVERRRALEIEQTRRQERKRIRIFAALAGGAAVVLAIVAVLALLALRAANDASQQKAKATYLGLASRAQSLEGIRPDVSLILALAAYLRVPRGASQVLARSSLMTAVEEIARSGATAILHGHEDTVTSVAFAPAGSAQLASASGDGTIKLWDTAVGDRGVPVTLDARAGAVLTVAYSPDGRLLASGHEDGRVRVWSLATHRLLWTSLMPPRGMIFRVAFSRDGSRLASASLDGDIHMWGISGGRPDGSPSLLKDPRLRSIAFSSDSSTLAGVGNDGVIRLWRVATGTVEGRARVPTPLYAVAFRPRTRDLFAGGRSGAVWEWRDAGRGAPARIEPAAHTIQDLAFNADGSRLASARSDDTILIGRPDPGAPLSVLRGHRGVVTGVSFSAAGQMLASGSTDRTVRLWNVSTHRGFGGPLAPSEGSVQQVAYSADGALLASGNAGRPAGVQLWTAATGASAGVLPSRRPVTSVGFSLTGRELVSGTLNGTVTLWRSTAHGWQGTRIVNQPGRAVYRVVFGRGGQFAFAGAGGTLGVWSPVTHRTTRFAATPDVPIYSVAFSRDGSILASGGDDRAIRLWRVADGRQIGLLTGVTDAIFSVAFSPDGVTLASGSADDSVRLWDFRHGFEIGRPLTGHNGYVRSVTFSPDGRTLVSGSSDGTARFWDVATRTQLGEPLSIESGSIESVSFSPRGDVLATGGGQDGATRLWSPVTLVSDHSTLVRSLCAVVGSSLSRSEWAQYAADLPYQSVCSR